MKLIRTFTNSKVLETGSVATIGNFDGFHLGHQALLSALKKVSKRLKLPLVVILFEPQPAEFFMGMDAPIRISSLREKLKALKQVGVDLVVCLRFNKVLSNMSAVDFAEQILFKQLKVKHLIVGQDFRFGRDKSGDIGLLANWGLKHQSIVEPFKDFVINHTRVSSTKIRTHLMAGEVELAGRLLGQPFSLSGRVTRGDGRGKLWGIPTANLNLSKRKLPLHGVFAVKVANSAGKVFHGVANIGNRPTVDGRKNILEVHLFDFDQCLYGQRLQVNFLHHLRAELKFSNVDELIAQIHQDILAAKAYFAASLNTTE